MKIYPKNNYQILFKSKTLEQALNDQNIDGKKFEVRNCFKRVLKNKELASTPIRDYLGCGSSAIAFETENGVVLKLSESTHYPLGRTQEDFDVPIYKKGKTKGIYYYFEEKLMQHDLNEGFVEIVRDMIIEKGYKPHDLEENATHQIGFSKNGALYLIDPECARHKTIFHALWKELKNSFNKLSFSRFSKALHKLKCK